MVEQLKKTFLTIALLTMFSLCLTGCGKEEEPELTTESVSTQSSSTEVASGDGTTQDDGVVYQYDTTKHWKQREDGSQYAVSNHEWGESIVEKQPTNNGEGVMSHECKVCGYIKTETIPPLNPTTTETTSESTTQAPTTESVSDNTTESTEHQHKKKNDKFKYDKDYHWYECSCGEPVDKEKHQWGEGQPTTEGSSVIYICSVCKNRKEEPGDGNTTESTTEEATTEATTTEQATTEETTEAPHQHMMSDDWKSNATKHWRECSCGEKYYEANHKFDSETNKCLNCGYKKANQDPVTDNTVSSIIPIWLYRYFFLI